MDNLAGDTRTLYNITKTLTGGFCTKTAVLNDEEENILAGQEEVLS